MSGAGRRDQISRTEIDELRIRLRQTEDELRAIHSGAIDAISIDTPEGLRIYTLENLRNSEELFRQIVEKAPDAILLYDAQTDRVMDANRAAEVLFGRSRAEIRGLSPSDLSAAEQPDELQPLASFAEYKRRALQGETVAFERIAKNALGNRYCQATLVSLQLPAGVHLRESLVDLTERRAAEEAERRLNLQLLQSEERFRKLAEAALDAIVVINAAGVVLYWNLAAERIFGYAAKEILGCAFQQHLSPPRYHRSISRALRTFAKNGRDPSVGKTLELVARRKDGAEIPVEVSITAARIDGEWQVFGNVRDISERRSKDKSLARALRALRTLSAGNGVLLEAATESDLLEGVCQVTVDAGYRMASVSYIDEGRDHAVNAVARAGIREDFYRLQPRSFEDSEYGRSPISRCIRSGKPEVARDLATDPGFAPWREEVVKRRLASNLAIPLSSGDRIFGGLSIYSSEADAFDEEETRLLTELADHLAFGVASLRTRLERDHLAEVHARDARMLLESLEQSIAAIAGMVEARDPYTAGHQRRVSELAVAIAREMNLEEDKIHGVMLAATVHDVGKIKIPAEILVKPTRLTKLEFEIIKGHPEAGFEILKDIAFPWPIAEIVLQHHERVDGTGYPRGLSGSDILIEARIVAVADVVEALASHRPYRPGKGVEAAVEEIQSGSGKLYDPTVVEACLKVLQQGSFTLANTKTLW